RVEVETHNPRIGQVRDGRDEVGDEKSARALGLNPHALHGACLPGYNFHVNAWQDFRVAREELGLRLGGGKTFGDIAAPVAPRGRERVLPHAALNKVACAGKRGQELLSLAANVPAAVVEMEVRVDDHVHAVQLDAALRELSRERGCVLDRVDVREL